ncbi:MAG: carbon monoxide dehydrogenase [Deltaproteobacteria bacterium RIFCSPLOWO2_02_FULL_57_26]|nr:MAG: carbon monoxide dehydrogenase [Deltaproteobacteria bacterium RIFCSPLOWO2_02_FULL_57_26]OGQ77710.1 MAG: carbon monoxide dehydrogenase [Deltaproteobacteria bacterium RIFCSPLOWO2_12_FULL_57_22]
MPISKLVGARVKRREDPRLIRGLAHYVDDIQLPNVLHAAILRSPYAHARIRAMRTDQARRHPGVVAVVTGNEIRDQVGCVPVASQNPTLRVPKRYVLAVDKVCFVGEGVVVVVAEDRYAARDALDLIEVDYEPLPVVSDPEKALASGAPVIHPEWPDNVAFRFDLKQGNLAKAFKEAERVVKQRLIHQRLAPIAIEPRGVLARYLPGEDELTLWSSTQIPHILKTQLSVMLKLPENRVRVIAPEVGGGFGSKLNVYAEEGLIGHLAIKLKRPVKWIEGRRENMQGTIHGRGQVGEVEVAVKKDGTILGLQYRVIADIGAYHQLLTPGIPPLTGLMLSGAYKIPALAIEVTGVFTNKVATDAYRGAGRPEATYVIERIIDRVAQELAIDPVKIRQKNFPRPKEFPFKTATGLIYDSGNYQGALNKALRLSGYQGWRGEQRKLREKGRYLGIGLSTYVEICGMGPSAAMPAGGWESGTVRVEPTGKVTVLTGVSPHGQGQETSFAQIVADEFGVPLDDIHVIHGDTAVVPSGIGTFGSRATAVGGTAVFQAAQKVKEKAREIAAHLLESDPEDLVFSESRFSVKGVPKKGVSLQEIALEAHLARNLPKKMEPGLTATSVFEPANFTFPFGAHICIVEVDPETGRIEIRKYVAVDDCGKVINPLLVDGQIHGGIAQGLGQALLEEVVYDEEGQLLTGSLMDYALPKAEDLPRLELARTETPTPVNPLGVKGVGEAGTIGSTPAIVNAVVDALAPFGVTHVDMPLKPEKIWRLCREKKERRAEGAG